MQRLPRVKDGLEHTFKPVKQHWLSVGGQTTASKEHVSHIFMLWCYRLSTLDGMTSFSFSKHGYYCLNTHLSLFSGFLILLQVKMQIFKNEPHIHCVTFSVKARWFLDCTALFGQRTTCCCFVLSEKMWNMPCLYLWVCELPTNTKTFLSWLSPLEGGSVLSAKEMEGWSRPNLQEEEGASAAAGRGGGVYWFLHPVSAPACFPETGHACGLMFPCSSPGNVYNVIS